MSDDGRIFSTSMIVAGVLGLLCCAAPVLVAILLTSVAAEFAFTGRLLTAALVGLVAVVAYLIVRQHIHSDAASGASADEAPIHDECCPSEDWERNPPSAT